jgi:hypothetical protein
MDFGRLTRSDGPDACVKHSPADRRGRAGRGFADAHLQYDALPGRASPQAFFAGTVRGPRVAGAISKSVPWMAQAASAVGGRLNLNDSDRAQVGKRSKRRKSTRNC